MEYTTTEMAIIIKDNGKMTCVMAMDSNFTQMELPIKEIGNKIKNMGKEYSPTKQAK
jgi:hypothetical protein